MPKFYCYECDITDQNGPCTLDLKETEFIPEHCPFDGTDVKWKPEDHNNGGKR